MKLHLIFCCEVGSSCHKTQNKYYGNITNGTLRISVGRQISSTVDPILLIGHFPNILRTTACSLPVPARRSGFRPFQYPGSARGKVACRSPEKKISNCLCAWRQRPRLEDSPSEPGASIPHHRGQAWYMTLLRVLRRGRQRHVSIYRVPSGRRGYGMPIDVHDLPLLHYLFCLDLIPGQWRIATTGKYWIDRRHVLSQQALKSGTPNRAAKRLHLQRSQISPLSSSSHMSPWGLRSVQALARSTIWGSSSLNSPIAPVFEDAEILSVARYLLFASAQT